MMTLFRGPITGPKFAAIFASFFGVIIAVNLVLAFKAVSTFPGLETANSYVASQRFDTDRQAQEALGWDVGAVVHGGELQLSIKDADGNPVQAGSVTGTFGRATSVRDDQIPAFVFDGSLYRAQVKSDQGNWNLRLVAVAADGTEFRQRIVVIVD
jgi:nitrogen fixation protein FixH